MYCILDSRYDIVGTKGGKCMDILFHHHEFEYEVRDKLGIPSDPITEEVLRVFS